MWCLLQCEKASSTCIQAIKQAIMNGIYQIQSPRPQRLLFPPQSKPIHIRGRKNAITPGEKTDAHEANRILQTPIDAQAPSRETIEYYGLSKAQYDKAHLFYGFNYDKPHPRHEEKIFLKKYRKNRCSPSLKNRANTFKIRSQIKKKGILHQSEFKIASEESTKGQQGWYKHTLREYISQAKLLFYENIKNTVRNLGKHLDARRNSSTESDDNESARVYGLQQPRPRKSERFVKPLLNGKII